ncbi:hypothetical protein [Halorhabdus amylolytica]|uniref:hypothetical protein n=1 Tax=Halorhabdus amylolytica TaxID=2559573 RepID=UPI0010AAC756|nr:hypothetical protein [Halorhabdus amylolytica]
MLRTLRRLGYGWIALQGLLAAALPKQVVGLSTKLSLSGFENADELDPKPWYLTAVRATGVGLIAAGLTGLLLESRDDNENEEPSVAIDAPESDEDA